MLFSELWNMMSCLNKSFNYFYTFTDEYFML